MKKIVKCVNEECDFERHAKEDEWLYKTVFDTKMAVAGQGNMVLCPKCNCQTTIIEMG